MPRDRDLKREVKIKELVASGITSPTEILDRLEKDYGMKISRMQLHCDLKKISGAGVDESDATVRDMLDRVDSYLKFDEKLVDKAIDAGDYKTASQMISSAISNSEKYIRLVNLIRETEHLINLEKQSKEGKFATKETIRFIDAPAEIDVRRVSIEAGRMAIAKFRNIIKDEFMRIYDTEERFINTTSKDVKDVMISRLQKFKESFLEILERYKPKEE